MTVCCYIYANCTTTRHILVCRKYTDIFTTVVGTPSFVNTILHHTQCRTTVLQQISVVPVNKVDRVALVPCTLATKSTVSATKLNVSATMFNEVVERSTLLPVQQSRPCWIQLRCQCAPGSKTLDSLCPNKLCDLVRLIYASHDPSIHLFISKMSTLRYFWMTEFLCLLIALTVEVL